MFKGVKKADFELTFENEIYRTGVIAQFNLTFELSWKALQEVLRIHGVESADVGSPRESLQLAYKVGFISDSESWLLMLKKRKSSVHVYNEDDADELVSLTLSSKNSPASIGGWDEWLHNCGCK